MALEALLGTAQEVPSSVGLCIPGTFQAFTWNCKPGWQRTARRAPRHLVYCLEGSNRKQNPTRLRLSHLCIIHVHIHLHVHMHVHIHIGTTCYPTYQYCLITMYMYMCKFAYIFLLELPVILFVDQ